MSQPPRSVYRPRPRPRFVATSGFDPGTVAQALVVVLVMAVGGVGWSYVQALTDPGAASWQARTVDLVRIRTQLINRLHALLIKLIP